VSLCFARRGAELLLELPLHGAGEPWWWSGASIGIATAGPDDSADELLRKRGPWRCIPPKPPVAAVSHSTSPYMHSAIAERVRVESGLRTAWLTGDLLVHYQPIVDLADGRMVSIEALARWKHPDGDVIPPNVFIPIAESTGLIIPIGARILNEACQQLAIWQREYGRRQTSPLSVNVSPRQLYSDDLVEIVRGGAAERRHRNRGISSSRSPRRRSWTTWTARSASQPAQGTWSRDGHRRFRCRGVVAGQAAPSPRRHRQDRQVTGRPRP